MSATDRLGIYLNDHLAGASAGVEMARRVQEAVQGDPAAEVLGPIATEIEEDLETLRRLVEVLGIGKNPVKQAAGWLTEKVHRLGVDERLTRSPDLTLLLQAESLSLGIEGKLALWLALMEVVSAHPQLKEVDLPTMAERARNQRGRVEAVRLGAARRTFATVD
ncbi:hypothetical protein [Pseudonocardia sp.]|uniref:hypothetical protein n=1 Tax=Pseudonocardia sp. TaxID=60912 RepID=UPI0031FC0274